MALDTKRLKVLVSVVIPSSVAMMNVHQRLMSREIDTTSLALPLHFDLVRFADPRPIVRVVPVLSLEQPQHKAERPDDHHPRDQDGQANG